MSYDVGSWERGTKIQPPTIGIGGIEVGRFDDIYSMHLDGAPDEDNMARRLIMKKELTRQKIVKHCLGEGTFETVFKQFDLNNDGKVTVAELREGLKEIGMDMLLEEATDLVKGIDKDGNGTLDLQEFSSFLEMNQSEHKLNKFNKNLEIERRQQMKAHKTTGGISDGGSGAPLWDEGYIPKPSHWDTYANGARQIRMRKTSAALGFENRQDVFRDRIEARALDNRSILRDKLKDKIRSSAGKSQANDGVDLFWRELRRDNRFEYEPPAVGIRVRHKSGELGTIVKVVSPRVFEVNLDTTGKTKCKQREFQSITLKISKKGYVSCRKFKTQLDRLGMSVLYQDSDDLFEQLDSNHDGKISYDELHEFMNADPVAVAEQAKSAAVRSAIKYGRGQVVLPLKGRLPVLHSRTLTASMRHYVDSRAIGPAGYIRKGEDRSQFPWSPILAVPPPGMAETMGTATASTVSRGPPGPSSSSTRMISRGINTARTIANKTFYKQPKHRRKDRQTKFETELASQLFTPTPGATKRKSFFSSSRSSISNSQNTKINSVRPEQCFAMSVGSTRSGGSPGRLMRGNTPAIRRINNQSVDRTLYVRRSELDGERGNPAMSKTI